jgi:hypothetical protein
MTKVMQGGQKENLPHTGHSNQFIISAKAVKYLINKQK